jgi:protein arginine kinase activator
MVCDVCGKNPATVHLTEIIDEQMNELHLCEECARKKSLQMEQQFGLSDLLAGLANFDKSQQGEEKESATKCPSCGLSYKDFKKIGRLGCGDCYGAFKKYLGPLLKRIHGANFHYGKCPAKVTPGKAGAKRKPDLQDLRCRLQKAIESEEYEEAARLRDQIREMQEKQGQEKPEQEKPSAPPEGDKGETQA